MTNLRLINQVFPWILLLLSSSLHANNANFVHVRETVFWQQLYTDKYHTLYCAVHKEAGQKSKITHIYSTDWMANAMNCADTNFCDFARFKDASSDLHNIWPIEEPALDIRRHYAFAEGEDSEGEKNQCNFITFPKGVEPRQWAKGEIARSVLYIIWKYRLPDFGQIPLMVQWANKYPPNAEEKWRNEKIKSLQRNDNPFISNPSYVNEVFAISKEN